VALQHKDSDVNNNNTMFEFTPENYEAIETILAKYPKESALSAVIPLLDLAQRQNDNWCVFSSCLRRGVSPRVVSGFLWRR
jgi:NADH:ubiquinone oxidoreductase subunit E